jgi:lipoprotein-anchoring transpeptidase ErfK/SrfK
MTSQLAGGAASRSRSAARLPAAVSLIACLCCAVCLSVVATAGAQPRRQQATARVPTEQHLALLNYGHRAYREPHTTSLILKLVGAHRPITGERTTLPVLAQTTDRHHQHWLKVMLPGRPNSSTGWIKQAGTQSRSTGWYIHISLAARRLWIYYRRALIRTFPVVVGKPSTPTPTGRFFVEETVIMPAQEPGGPFALALSARSNVFQQFDGGPGQIAIHGRDLLGGTPGQAQSHGCIRLTTPDIDWLAARVAPGAPVTITQFTE